MSRHASGFAGWRLAAPTSVCLLAPFLAGCLSKSGSGGAEGLVLALCAPADQSKAWQEVAEAFTTQTKIPVALRIEAPARHYAALPRSDADVVQIDSTRFPEFAASGALLNLDAHVAADKSYGPGDFLPQAWKSYEYQGARYGLPTDVMAIATYLNQDLFEARYIPLPKRGWTWDDYLRLARECTADTNGDGSTDTYGTALSPWWQVFVWQNGGDLVDDPTNPTRSTLSAPEARAGLQWMADLALKHKVTVPGGAAVRMASFCGGRVAMAFARRAEAFDISRKADFRWFEIEIPGGKARANLGLGSGMAIARGCRRPDDAYRLLRYLTTGDGLQMLLGAGFTCPAYLPLANSSYFTQNLKHDQNPYYVGLKLAHPMPFTPRYADLAQVWDEELPRLWTGEATVEEVTTRIDERVNSILAASRPAAAWLAPLDPHG